MRQILAVALLVAASALAACQSQPNVAQTRSNETSALSAPVSTSSPVDQQRALVYAPTFVLGAENTVNPRNGQDASGAVKGSGRQDGESNGGATQGGSQTGGAQSMDPKAVSDAIGTSIDAMSGLVSATGAAGQLLKTARGKLDKGDVAGATADLQKAQAAAKTEIAVTKPNPPQ